MKWLRPVGLNHFTVIAHRGWLSPRKHVAVREVRHCCTATAVSTTVLFFLHGDMFFWFGQPHRAEPDLDLKEIII